MTPTESDTLAKRITNLWRITPTLGEWRDYLAPLNATRAGHIVDQLRTTVEGAMSIARYHAAYQAHLTDEKQNRPTPDPVCDHCRRTGDEHADGCPHQAIPYSDPRAQAAFNRGLVQGLADLDAIRSGEPDPWIH